MILGCYSGLDLVTMPLPLSNLCHSSSLICGSLPSKVAWLESPESGILLDEGVMCSVPSEPRAHCWTLVLLHQIPTNSGYRVGMPERQSFVF